MESPKSKKQRVDSPELKQEDPTELSNEESEGDAYNGEIYPYVDYNIYNEVIILTDSHAYASCCTSHHKCQKNQIIRRMAENPGLNST